MLGKLEDLEFEGAQQRSMDCRVLEQRENVDKLNAGDREVREALEGAEQSYLCTGEFGGTGGGGGGLSSRGIVGIGRRGGGAASQDGGFDRGRGDLVFAGLRQRLGSVGGSAHVEGREGGKEGRGRKARQAGAVLVSQEQEKKIAASRVCSTKCLGVSSGKRQTSELDTLPSICQSAKRETENRDGPSRKESEGT